jgi:hypothetical protein
MIMSIEQNKKLAAQFFAVREYLDTQHVAATWFEA